MSDVDAIATDIVDTFAALPVTDKGPPLANWLGDGGHAGDERILRRLRVHPLGPIGAVSRHRQRREDAFRVACQGVKTAEGRQAVADTFGVLLPATYRYSSAAAPHPHLEWDALFDVARAKLGAGAHPVGAVLEAMAATCRNTLRNRFARGLAPAWASLVRMKGGWRIVFR